MTNHPNRNWRGRMRQACTDWLARWQLEHDPGGRLSEPELSRMRDAYAAGFEAGRSPPSPKDSPP
jgi:hypothetical protein